MTAFDPKDLRLAVDDVTPVAASSKGLKLFEFVRLSAEGNRAEFRAMSEHSSASRSVPCEGDELDLLLPYGLLTAFARSATARVTIQPDGKGGAEFKSGPMKARLPGIDPTDFPEPFSWDGAETIYAGDLSAFASLVGRVAPIAIHDPKSHHTAKKCVRFLLREGKASAVAFDDHFMAMIESEGDGEGEWYLPAPFAEALPTEGQGAIARLTNGMYGARGEGWHRTHAALDMGNKFPPFESKLPPADPVMVSVPRADLGGAIARVRSLADMGEIPAVVLAPTSDGLLVSNRDSKDGRAAQETVDSMVCEGAPFALNANYVQRVLKVLHGEEVRLSYSNPDNLSPFRGQVMFSGSEGGRAVVATMAGGA